MTAVARDVARARPGPARSSGRRSRWAIDNGLDVLETGNDTDNRRCARSMPGSATSRRRTPRPARSAVRRHHGPVTDDTTRPRRQPADAARSAAADPVEYDSPRARIARAKGLEAPYIAGGGDPDPLPGLARGAPLRHGCCWPWSSTLCSAASSSAWRSTIATGGTPPMTPVAAPSSGDRRRRPGRPRRPARRDAARPDPHPVDQPAAARRTRRRARWPRYHRADG